MRFSQLEKVSTAEVDIIDYNYKKNLAITEQQLGLDRGRVAKDLSLDVHRKRF